MSHNINLQQQPKEAEYLKCWEARKGFKLIGTDFASVEPVMLTVLSRDPALLRVYGPQAKPNDIYLFTGSHLGSLGDTIRKYYDPDNPTAEMIKVAKQQCKRERQIAKTVHLAATYNAFPTRIYEALVLAGVDIEYEEVVTMRENYWELYKGVIKFKEALEEEWDINKGFVRNAFGRPLAVGDLKLKDIINTVIQSSGHDLLMLLIVLIERERKKRRVPMYPWIVDYHDETIWEVEDSAVDTARDIFTVALKRLNELMSSDIIFKGDIIVADNLATIKEH